MNLSDRFTTLGVVILAALTQPAAGLASPPDWFQSGRIPGISNDTHLYGMGTGTTAEAAFDDALADMAKQIQVSIENVTESYIASYRVNDREVIEETFKSTTRTVSELSVRGAQIIRQAHDGGQFYVAAAVSRAEFLQDLRLELDRKKASLDSVNARSKELIGAGRVFQAIDLMMSTVDLYSELASREAIHTTVAGYPYFGDDLPTGPAILADVRGVIGRLGLSVVSGDGQAGKRGYLLPEPITIGVTYMENTGQSVALPGIKLKLKGNNGEVLERQRTDDKGECRFHVYALGDDHGRVTVTLDLANVPRALKKDLTDRSVTVSYSIIDVKPLTFHVRIFGQDNERIRIIEEKVAASLAKAGQTVTEGEGFLVSGVVSRSEPRVIDGFAGRQYLVEIKLRLDFMKTSSTRITSTEFTFKGMSPVSADDAFKQALNNAKVPPKKLSKTVAGIATRLKDSGNE